MNKTNLGLCQLTREGGGKWVFLWKIERKFSHRYLSPLIIKQIVLNCITLAQRWNMNSSPPPPLSFSLMQWECNTSHQCWQHNTTHLLCVTWPWWWLCEHLPSWAELQHAYLPYEHTHERMCCPSCLPVKGLRQHQEVGVGMYCDPHQSAVHVNTKIDQEWATCHRWALGE